MDEGTHAYERCVPTAACASLRFPSEKAPMLFPSATVVAALVISLAGAAPLEARTATRGASRSVGRASTKIAAGLWAPKKSKPRPARDEDPREEELLKSKSSGGEA